MLHLLRASIPFPNQLSEIRLCDGSLRTLDWNAGTVVTVKGPVRRRIRGLSGRFTQLFD
jgi:hypothetical protein